MAVMMNRGFWNPVLAFTGGLTLVSGIFLFFHLKSRTIIIIHELGGLVFAIACIVHLALNIRPLLKTIGGHRVAWAMLAVLLFSGLGMALSVSDGGRNRGPHHGRNYQEDMGGPGTALNSAANPLSMPDLQKRSP